LTINDSNERFVKNKTVRFYQKKKCRLQVQPIFFNPMTGLDPQEELLSLQCGISSQAGWSLRLIPN
jgi:hypothetical protein